LKILLIGDSCVDEYHYGSCDKLSPEAPVPIFKFKRKEQKNGMASNVKNNLEALGVEVISYLSKESKKIRYIDEKSNQHLLRIDEDIVSEPLKTNIDLPKDIDGIVISDYEKGFVSYELIGEIIQRYSPKIPIYIDTKKRDLQKFKNCFIKINEFEYSNRVSDGQDVIVTFGSSHVQYKNKKFSVPKIKAFDVCGAGDTFLSAFSFAHLLSKDIDIAIEFAIKASSITIQHVGVYSPDLGEILC
jgi:D-beta-D-heptose 7-phosphate kinase/D-beta-D-heptose 1-phosphate adenosyltransferase